MRVQKIRQIRLKRLLPAGLVALALAFAVGVAGPAHADTWSERTWDVATKDADGAAVAVGFRWYGDGVSEILYRAVFDPYGEILTVRDDHPDGHAAKVIFRVYGSTGTIDVDTFYVGTADTGKTFNLGTPDGTGDITEGRQISVQICINETSRCSTQHYGKA